MKLSFSIAALLLLSACTYHRPDSTVTSSGYIAPSAPVVAQQEKVVPKGTISPNVTSIKVALLVPLSGDSVGVGNAMLDAATMALSDSYFTVPPDQIHAQIVLLPKDTGATPADAASAAQQAIDQGATFIIGPLFSQSVSVVAPIAKAHNVNVLTFSNNRAVAGNDIFLFGFLPEQQVERVTEYAYLHNLQRVAALVPNDTYGQKIKDALADSYSQKGGIVSPSEVYSPSQANIDAAVSRMAAAYNNSAVDRRFQAIFIADGGAQLKNIIAAMKKNHIDLKKIKLLGTGLWDDPAIAKIPEMEGAWFSSSPPGQYQIFEKRFVTNYNYKPVRLASLAYDAVTLVATLALPGPQGLTTQAMTVQQGFDSPANGLMRLKADGTCERKLDIMEVTPGGFKVIDYATKSFAN